MQALLGIHSQTHSLIHVTRPGTSAYHSPERVYVYMTTKPHPLHAVGTLLCCGLAGHSCAGSKGRGLMARIMIARGQSATCLPRRLCPFPGPLDRQSPAPEEPLPGAP